MPFFILPGFLVESGYELGHFLLVGLVGWVDGYQLLFLDVCLAVLRVYTEDMHARGVLALVGSFRCMQSWDGGCG